MQKAKQPCRAATLLLASVLLGGCATYHSVPLTPHSTALQRIDALHIDPHSMPLPALAAHRFDPSDGLDITETAMLAVANNPDLKLARDDAGIAHAQAFAAGLLPDPQLNLTGDFPSPSIAGLIPAFNRGLSFDFTSLITHAATHEAATASAQKTDLALLWQEWQVVAQARQLFVRIATQRRLAAVLQQALTWQTTRYQAAQAAMTAGNLTLGAVTPYLVAQQDIQRQLAELGRQQNQSRHNLNALLGLAPQVHLDLVGSTRIAPLNLKALRRATRDLAKRRPDLLALAAGYQSQEAKVRAAILAQFPSLNIGFTRARDTAGVYTTGFSVSISLPIFNRNRGNIAVERATRQRLKDEYQSRLNKAENDIDRLLAEQQLLEQQRSTTLESIRILQANTQKAATAYSAHRITLNLYIDLESALYTKQIEAINLDQTLLEQRIALQALLGGELPHQAASKTSTPIKQASE
ncbi:MAG: TolC family protein [Candidimonas sp.]|nr:MAG: TolC family protein [Candidimonas sp.]TAM24126.1 MAG: TolC family protein [Candidimonas sp.]TAM76856.1 MAG: TolC family protein [Candidimonas sp.]